MPETHSPRRPNPTWAAFSLAETRSRCPDPTNRSGDQITAAATELKLARRDGSAEWITKAAAALDALIDLIPRLPETPSELVR